MPKFSRRSLLGLAALPLAPRLAVAQQLQAPTWLPLPRDTLLQRIAFGSCLHQRAPQPIWKSVIAANPQLFVMTGDNVYGDVSDGKLKELVTAYEEQAKQPEFAAARERIPFLATWDDHDYGLNDASGDFPHKAGTRALFAKYWNIPEASLPDGGIYRSGVFGPEGRRLQVILLDLRSFRSRFAEASAAERIANLSPAKYKPDPALDKTMLGTAQWAWLEAQLKVPAEIRVLVSSTQLLAENHGWDRWGHLPRERERLFKLIASTGAKGVIAISGDRHRAAIYRRTADVPYPLYDITSSALNISRAGAESDDPGRLSAMLTEDNFGLLAIDWEKRSIRGELVRLSGIKHDAIDVPFTALGHAA